MANLSAGGALDPAKHPLDLPTERQWTPLIAEAKSTYLHRSTPGAIGGNVVVATAGPPGVGKSVALAARADTLTGFRRIDPDDIKDDLLDALLRHGYLTRRNEYALPDGQPVAPRELSTFIQARSTYIADVVRAEALDRGENLVIEGTMNWDGIADQFMDELTAPERRYRSLTILDVEAPVADVLSQAKDRWLRDRGTRLGGRFVPPWLIEAMYKDGVTTSESNARLLFEAARDERFTVELELRKREEGGGQFVEIMKSERGQRPVVVRHQVH